MEKMKISITAPSMPKNGEGLERPDTKSGRSRDHAPVSLQKE